MADVMQIKQWLQRTHHIEVPSDWLEECTEFIQSENPGQRITPQDMKSLVYEQWLVSDLRELACPCLPESLYENNQKSFLSGYYALQMDSIVDVSVPLYSQLQKHAGTENANVHVCAETQPSQPAWASKANRTLIMSLTDGVQNIKAMEYQPIRALNTDHPPGIKVLIQGEIMCRRGVLMLTRENIVVLGGDVEQLYEENTQEKLLTSLMEQNRNIEPEKLEKHQFTPSQSNGSFSHQNHPRSQQQRSMNQVNVRQQQRPSSHAKVITHVQQPQQTAAQDMMDFDDDDDLLASLDEAQMTTQAEAQMSPMGDDSGFSRTFPSNQNTSVNSMSFIQTTVNNNRLIQGSKHKASVNNSEQTNVNGISTEACRSVDDHDTMHGRVPSDDEAQNDGDTASARSSECPTKDILTAAPYTYLSLLPRRTSDTITIKGYISTLTSRLDHNNGCRWSLGVKVNDGTAAVDMDLSDQMLTALIGFSAPDSLRLREAAKTDAVSRCKLSEGVKGCQKKLISLSGLMDITFPSNGMKPRITSHRDINMADLLTLKSR